MLKTMKLTFFILGIPHPIQPVWKHGKKKMKNMPPGILSMMATKLFLVNKWKPLKGAFFIVAKYISVRFKSMLYNSPELSLLQFFTKFIDRRPEKSRTVRWCSIQFLDHHLPSLRARSLSAHERQKLTFALDKNPPGSMFSGSNYGEPDAYINPQGSGEKKWHVNLNSSHSMSQGNIHGTLKLFQSWPSAGNGLKLPASCQMKSFMWKLKMAGW